MIRVNVTHTRNLTKKELALRQLPNRLAVPALRAFMKKVLVPEVDRMMLRHWSTKGRAYGHTWPELADETIRKRTDKGTIHKGILVDTEHLFKTIFKERLKDSRLRAVSGGVRLALNVGVRYAKFHQYGDPAKNLPIRQVVPDPLPPSFVRTIRALIRAYILTGKM